MPLKQSSIYNIPSHQPFLQTLLSGLRKLSPEEFQSAVILLPTRRACTALRDLFLKQQTGQNTAMVLPTIRQLSMVDEDELLLSPDADLAKAILEIPAAISPMRRRLLLTRLILSQKEPDVSHTQAFLLAGDLGRLIDQVLIENCDFKNLENLVEGDLPEHWKKIVRFLSIVTQHWPAILAQDGLIETVDRRKRLIQLQIDYWQKHKPSHPIIAAGSTGSHPSTADLLKTIARLPKGAVILPGLDETLDEPSWNAIGPTHPQYLLKKLLKKLDVERDDVVLWHDAENSNAPRLHFLTEVMRPAEHSDNWEQLRTDFTGKTPWQGMQNLTAQHEQEEAVLAALMLRHTLENADETVGLITPDRSLAIRVAATLRRWNIVVDDSAGTPLSQTSLASFFTLLLQLARPDLKPSDLMAFLKHPNTALGLERAECLRLARSLEEEFFRTAIRGQGLLTWQSLADAHTSQIFDILCAEITALPLHGETKPFVYWLDMHLRLAHAWSVDNIWQGNEGEVLAEYMDALRAHAADYLCTLEDYTGIFSQGLHSETVRMRYGQHPRIHILGLIEARMLSFDHVILAGLNEGTWPETPTLDPWMSPFMRVKFGLPSPDQHIGQTAHDFIQLASQSRVTLLRCERNSGTPTNPSRWLLRLQAVLKMLDAENALSPQLPWHEWVRSLDAVSVVEPCDAPAVSVAPSALPKKLSATNIELWVGDPYAFYAKKVLQLFALGDLDAEMGAMERGNIFHAALDGLAKEFPNHWPPAAQERFIELLGQGFQQQGSSADEWHMMLPRMHVLAREVWQFEKQRRAEINAFYTEKRGEMALEFKNYKPILQAKADKIEVLPDNTLRILDYKTGKIPSVENVESALKPQLLVEAIIAQNKGYADIASTTTSEIGYIAITEGSALLDDKKPMKLDGDNTVLAHQQGLLDFIAAYLNNDATFHSAPRPALISPSPDYARLARVAEWSKGEIAQEDAG